MQGLPSKLDRLTAVVGGTGRCRAFFSPGATWHRIRMWRCERALVTVLHAQSASHMHSLQLRIIMAMSILGALALMAVIVRMFAGHGTVPVELVAADIGPVRPILRSEAATVEACVVPAAKMQADARVRRVLARPGQAVRRGTLLAEVEEEAGVLEALGTARRAAANASASAHELCRRSPLQDGRRDLLGEIRRESVARISEGGETVQQVQLQACARARRDVSAAIGKVGALRADLERYRVRAAFDGVLTAVRVAPGDAVQAGADAGIELAKDGCRAARVRLPAAARNLRVVGRPASACVRFASGSGHPRCDAVVRSVTTGGDPGGKGAEMVVEFGPDGPDNGARIGATATVEIPLPARERATRVPITAVLPGGRVLVFDAASRTLSERRIRVGQADDVHVEVLSGLDPGERIARTPGALAIEEGEPVEPIGVPR